MFQLYKLNDDKYLILMSNGKEIEGSKVYIVRELVHMYVEADEIITGLDALEENDVAHYGINRTFIFSTKVYTNAS